MDLNTPQQLDYEPPELIESGSVHVQGQGEVVEYVKPKSENFRLTVWTAIAAILVILFIALVGYVLIKSQNRSSNVGSSQLPQKKNDFSVVGLDQLNLGQIGQIDINGALTINGAVVIKPSAQPASPLSGQLYYDSESNQLAYYDGSQFLNLSTSANTVSSIGGVSGGINLGLSLIHI